MKRYSTVTFIACIIIMVTLIYSSLFGSYFFKQLNDQARSTLHSESLDQLEFFKNEFEDQAYKIEATVNAFSLSMINLYQETISGAYTLDDMEVKIETLFRNYVDSDLAVSKSIYVYFDPSLDGQVHDVWINKNVTAKREAEIPLDRYENRDNMTWFYGPKEAMEASWTKPYTNRYNRYVTSYVMPIIYEGNFLGILGMYLDLTDLNKIIAAYNNTNSGIFWVLNNDDTILYHPYYDAGSSAYKGYYNLDLNESFTSDIIDTKEYWHLTTSIDNGWVFIHTVDTSTIQAQANSIRTYYIIGIIILITALVALFSVIKRRIYIHFNRLLLAIQNSQKGHYNSVFTNTRNYEINKLSTALKSSFDNTNHTIEGLKVQAYIDQSTGLANSNQLMNEFFLWTNEDSLSIMTIDIDQYKALNDVIGHDQCDHLKVEIANKLKKLISEASLYALSSDEFVIINPTSEFITKLPDQIIKSIESSDFSAARHISITCSIGISIYPNDGKDIKVLLEKSRRAVIEAKKNGGNQYKIFSRFKEDLRFDLQPSQIKEGIQNNLFKIAYQAFYDKAGDIKGYQAILQYNNDGKNVDRSLFLPQIEKYAFISELGEHTLKLICKDIAELYKQNKYLDQISILVTARQILNPNFVSSTIAIIRQNKIKPSIIEFQLDQHVFNYDVEKTIKKINALSVLGFQFSLNGFALSQLSIDKISNLPINKVVLDQDPKQIENHEQNYKLLKKIIILAHAYGYAVHCVDIENEEAYQTLEKLGCDFFQGLLLSSSKNSIFDL